MTEYTAVTDWTTITTGQKVRATRDGEHLEFTVSTKAVNSGVTLRSSQSIVQICTYDRPVWSLEVEKAAFVLPTVPGTVIRAKGKTSAGWVYERGEIKWFSTDGDVYSEDTLIRHLSKTGFEILRPEAEVAAEVLAELVTEFNASAPSFAAIQHASARWATS